MQTMTTAPAAADAPDCRPLGDVFRAIADEYDHEADATARDRLHRNRCRAAAEAWRHAAHIADVRAGTDGAFDRLARIEAAGYLRELTR